MRAIVPPPVTLGEGCLTGSLDGARERAREEGGEGGEGGRVRGERRGAEEKCRTDRQLRRRSAEKGSGALEGKGELQLSCSWRGTERVELQLEVRSALARESVDVSEFVGVLG